MKQQVTESYNRRVSLQLGQLLLLALMLTPPGAAQTAAIAGQVRGAAILDSEAPSRAEVDRAITLAASYLERACEPDGKFKYLIDISSGQQSNSYNIVRHAGAMYAFAMLQHAKPEESTVLAMDRAASFLLKNYIGPGVNPDQQVVWSKPLPASSPADLGATGLGLVALTAVEQAKPDAVRLQQLQSLGRFLLFMQKSDGSFVSKYRPESGPVEDFESLYYPGEAALGFIDLYEADHSLVWLNAAAKALSYLAKSRAGLSTVPLDHWALIATAKLLPDYAKSASPASREELIQHAVQICQALMKDQLRDPSNPALDGSFDSMGRTSPTATRMEGLLAALEFLPNGNLGQKSQKQSIMASPFCFAFRFKMVSMLVGCQEPIFPEPLEAPQFALILYNTRFAPGYDINNYFRQPEPPSPPFLVSKLATSESFLVVTPTLARATRSDTHA